MTAAIQTTDTENKPQSAVQALMDRMKPTILGVLPKYLTPDRMMKVLFNAFRATPDLAKCDQASLSTCIINCASMGLEPNTPEGLAYLIPRNKNRKVGNEWVKSMECTLMIGYQGFIRLARNSGQIADIYAEAVFEGDEFDWELGLSRTLRHKPTAQERSDSSKLTHVYAVAKLTTGETPFIVLTRSEIEARRKVGASGQTTRDGRQVSTPWDGNYIIMARKTGIRDLYRWLPRSAEMQVAADVELQHELSQVVEASGTVTQLHQRTFSAALAGVPEAPALQAPEEESPEEIPDAAE